MGNKKTTKERGLFKQEIHSALYKNENIREILLGDTSGMSTAMVMAEFKKHVKSHLFIEDTITDTGTYIYYDVIMPQLHSNTKDCRVTMYLICHRDILDNGYTKEGYVGDRADILSQMVEETLLDKSVVNNFGIGELTLDSINIYNATRFYGCILTFVVPNFR
jgi:hypothetical protein